MTRCKRCGMVLSSVSGFLADITALLDMEARPPAWCSLRLLGDDAAQQRMFVRAQRMGAALSLATEALAISHGYCSRVCALAVDPDVLKAAE